MTVAEWDRIKELFDATLLLPEAERDGFLKFEAGTPLIWEEVHSLLSVYQASPEFLEGNGPLLPSTLPADCPDSPLAGRRIGAWQLVREIGRGGMGTVWEAHRSDGQYEQRAAVKLLPTSLLSRSDILRFRDERQILASLEHPGIARLLDGGALDDGSPYLVMEYIEGSPLDQWSDTRAGSLRERLEVFLSICAAVEYAHRRLVVHRDLKPANILVTEDGRPMLLDFGIAKFLGAGAGLTRTGGRLLTPEYASPEQLRGDTITTSSDVFSLGVLLYLLLTGRKPWAAAGNDPLGIMHAICEREPPPPSTVAPAGASQLRGELDAITLQALRKSPEERYASVGTLAEDVSAWLDHRPVKAHHAPWWRRSLKYIRRHRAQSAAAAAVLVSMFAGTGISLWYARQAQHERAVAETHFNQVRQLAHAAIFDLNDAIQDLPGSLRARHMLVERALEYLRDLAASGRNVPELQLEIATGYLRIGEAQGNLGHAQLGNTKAAFDSQKEARRVAKEILRSNPGDAAAESVLARADEHLARLGEWQGDLRAVQELYDESMAIRQKEAARHPGVHSYRARAMTASADNFTFQKNWPAALPLYQEAVAAYREAIVQEPGNPVLVYRLINTYRNQGFALRMVANLPAALDCFRQAQRLDRQRVAASPGSIPAQIDLSFDLIEAGWLEHLMGQHRQALADLEPSLGIQDRVAAADPEDTWMKVEAAKLLNTLGFAYEAAGYRGRAIEAFKTGGARLEAALAHDPADEDIRLHTGWVWTNLGETYLRDATAGVSRERALVDRKNAAVSFRRAIDGLKRMKFQGRSDIDVHPDELIAKATVGLVKCRQRIR